MSNSLSSLNLEGLTQVISIRKLLNELIEARRDEEAVKVRKHTFEMCAKGTTTRFQMAQVLEEFLDRTGVNKDMLTCNLKYGTSHVDSPEFYVEPGA